MMKMKLHFVAGEQAWRHLFFTALCSDGWQTHCCHSGGQELEENGRWRTVRLVPQVMCCPQGNVADGPLVDPVTNELALHWWRHHTLVYLLNVRRNLQKTCSKTPSHSLCHRQCLYGSRRLHPFSPCRCRRLLYTVLICHEDRCRKACINAVMQSRP